MSDTNDQTDTEVQDQAQEPQEPAQEPQDAAQEHGPNAEAAKYRHKLRDTEAERDKLLAERDTRRRADLQKMVGDGSWTDKPVPVMHNPSDLFDVVHVDIDGMFQDDGSLNSDAVAEVLNAAQEERGYLFEPNASAVADWQAAAAKKFKLPDASIIKGATEQECMAHAEALSHWIPGPGYNPLAGKRPDESQYIWTGSFGPQLD